MRLLRDIALVLFALALLAASWLAYRADRRERTPIEAFVDRFELDLRRADDVATLRLQPQADLGAVIAASMTLEDVYGSVRMKDLDPATRAAWVRSVAATGGEIDAAIELALRAVELRPGWAFHHSMLAQLVYTKSRRESPAAVVRDVDRWEVPALLACALAPGNHAIRAFLGGGYLEIIGRADTRQAPQDALRAAMRSARFVERSYGAVVALEGSETAIGLLPDDATVLRVAMARELRERNAGAASSIRARLDSVVAASRAADLERIETLARRGDRYGLQLAVPAWVSAYSLEELDTPQGRREASRVAALWPPMRRGAWPNDPRARLLRYFLDGREAGVDGAVLARLAGSLSGVPEPVAARALALGDDPFAAQELLFASQSRGGFEWTPAIVEIARAFLRRGDAERARKILDELAPGARDECGPLLAARDAAPDPAAREALSRRIASMTPQPIPASAWSGAGTLALCVDPTTRSRAVVDVAVGAAEPALVSWGWDGGRSGSVVVRGPTTIPVPLESLSGRRALAVRAEAGGKIVLGESAVR
ncbi:MAG: hypothetical protein NDJ92_13705 [Thermoanaerobaculia bacterium]|nr:hypothetical protein [Thermoanaerobaculia bacterium]